MSLKNNTHNEIADLHR